METKDIRHANARRLLAAYKAENNIENGDGITQFAKEWGKARSQVSALMGLTMRKPIGSTLARSLEKLRNKPTGWLDIIHGDSSASIASNPGKKNDKPYMAWVPVITWNMAAKRGAAISWDDLEMADFCYPCMFGDDGISPWTYALEVNTDSMARLTGKSYPEGAVIYVEPDLSEFVVPGDIVIAKVDGQQGALFRELASEGGNNFLKPFNPTYPKIFDTFTVLGKVIGMYQPE